MKKKYLFVAILLLCVIVVSSFIACDKVEGTETQEHTHVFDREVATEAFLKTPASCASKAIYYKSCACGEKGTETFESGEKLEHTYNKVGFCACGASIGWTVEHDNHTTGWIEKELPVYDHKVFLNVQVDSPAVFKFADIRQQPFWNGCDFVPDSLFSEIEIYNDDHFLNNIFDNYFDPNLLDPIIPEYELADVGFTYYFVLTLESEFAEELLFSYCFENQVGHSYSNEWSDTEDGTAREIGVCPVCAKQGKEYKKEQYINREGVLSLEEPSVKGGDKIEDIKASLETKYSTDKYEAKVEITDAREPIDGEYIVGCGDSFMTIVTMNAKDGYCFDVGSTIFSGVKVTSGQDPAKEQIVTFVVDEKEEHDLDPAKDEKCNIGFCSKCGKYLGTDIGGLGSYDIKTLSYGETAYFRMTAEAKDYLFSVNHALLGASVFFENEPGTAQANPYGTLPESETFFSLNEEKEIYLAITNYNGTAVSGATLTVAVHEHAYDYKGQCTQTGCTSNVCRELALSGQQTACPEIDRKLYIHIADAENINQLEIDVPFAVPAGKNVVSAPKALKGVTVYKADGTEIANVYEAVKGEGTYKQTWTASVDASELYVIIECYMDLDTEKNYTATQTGNTLVISVEITDVTYAVQ